MVTTLESFSSDEACRLSGATYRQLDYWVRVGWVEPSVVPAVGSGSARRFARQDVLDMALMRMFVDAGCWPSVGARAALAARGHSGFVMVSGETVLVAPGALEVRSWVAAALEPVLVCAIPTWESLQ